MPVLYTLIKPGAKPPEFKFIPKAEFMDSLEKFGLEIVEKREGNEHFEFCISNGTSFLWVSSSKHQIVGFEAYGVTRNNVNDILHVIEVMFDVNIVSEHDEEYQKLMSEDD